MVREPDAGLRLTLPFFGLRLGSHYTVQLTNQTVASLQTSPTDSTAGYRLGADGKEYQLRSNVSAGAWVEITGFEWLEPKDGFEADLYECLATITVGALTTGTAGSWLALTADRSWTVTRTNDAAGTDTCTFTLDIRKIGTTINLASATITLNAEVQL